MMLRNMSRVSTRVPDRFLLQNLAYRDGQLTGEFAARTGAWALGAAPMTIAVTGNTGLIGTALCAFLSNVAHKEALRDSRIDPTRRLAELVGTRPFVVASAVGFYGPDRGDEVLTETSDRGDGFLAELVAELEAAADPVAVRNGAATPCARPCPSLRGDAGAGSAHLLGKVS